MLNQYARQLSLLRHFFLNVYSVEGNYDGNPLRIMVAEDGTTLDYITKLAFPEGAKVTKIKTINALNGPKLADISADIVVVGANRLQTEQYIENGFRIIPKWLHLSLPVCEDPYARLSAFGRTTRSYFNRKIHKLEAAGFECEVVDSSWFQKFYHEMYKPYSISRFNEEACIYKPSILKKFLDKGFLIIARKANEPVAGVMVYQEGDILHIPFGGITGGDVELVKEGAMFALHFFIAKKALSWGCNSIDFGRSRPFLSDGTLTYKTNWHMNIKPSSDVPTIFALATLGDTSQALKFLEANPHFYLSGEECLRSDKDEPRQPIKQQSCGLSDKNLAADCAE